MRIKPQTGLGVAILATFAWVHASCTMDEAEPREGAWAHVPEPAEHTPHYTFFNEPFPDGPSVTKACMACHEDAAHEVMKTAHWRWEGEPSTFPGHEEPVRIGKKNTINNFCIGVRSNWGACTTCHIGYGWKDETFDFEDPSLVDCLGCHDQTGTYAKKAKGAGLPDPNVDLLAVARSVGRPGRSNCGGCHFNGGGGNGVKHGDLDMSMTNPGEQVDVHMGGLGLTCVDCHQTEHHNVPGRSMSVSVTDTNRVSCTDCHDGERVHEDPRLEIHTKKVACQACHIPEMAVEEPTKMTWDWSEAGKDLDIKDPHVYLKIKGRFTYAKDIAPEYAWYNGTSTHYIIGDKMDPTKPTLVAGPLGTREDPKAKLWPFKIHRTKQPYDKVHKTLLVPNVFGPEGFWTKFDWPTALENGSKANGLAFSGEFDFAPTEMYWPLSHMVAPKERALSCRDCHGPRGRLDWKGLGYDGDPLAGEAFEHDAVELLDAAGESVAETGQPLSLKETCSACHELDSDEFAAKHKYHRGLGTARLEPEREALLASGPEPAPREGESNCLLCHLKDANEGARRAALAAGKVDWAVTATLVGTKLVAAKGAGYAWDADAFDGGEAELALGPPTEENCGACHGRVHNGTEPLTLDIGGTDAVTEKTGQVFSYQKIRVSGLNLKDKKELRRSWDIHAERLVTCSECHYAGDVPSRFADAKPDRPYEPGARRDCQSCHSTEGSHPWLDKKDAHFAALSCEACHISKMYAPAQELVDRTVRDAEGRPVMTHRGLEETGGEQFLTGWTPTLLPRRTDGKLAPFNLVTTAEWVDGPSWATIPEAKMRAAWFAGDAVRPEILAALDADHDGALSAEELRLDTLAKEDVVKKALLAAGVADPRLMTRVDAHALHHNVGNGDWAIRECTACHTSAVSGLPGAAPVALAPRLPAGAKPILRTQGEAQLQGTVSRDATGAFYFNPAPAPAKTAAEDHGGSR
ncbi:MAG: tetrathionate reductase family octaheme c-type cytochrome [Deltaproteobacteria bacterium]|nr:MAG: tetrathionate reductase family octaheme c-type cytochrome [Deltaproteobacteria bacterium]